MLVLTDLMLALLGKLAAIFAVEAVAARRIILRLDLSPEGLSLLIELLSLLVLPGSFVNSNRTVVMREGVAGGLNHLSGNS
jgi:hypothetical protein